LVIFCALVGSLQAQSGTLDITFTPGTGVDRLIYSVALQTNGAILIAGDFTRFGGTARTNVARLNVNGTLDTTFAPGPSVGGADPFVNAVAVQPSGKVLLGGRFTSPVATNLARLNTNGTLDSSFVAQADDLTSSTPWLCKPTAGSLLAASSRTWTERRARAWPVLT
jgi:uncharacterized delta-60 repeat protein